MRVPAHDGSRAGYAGGRAGAAIAALLTLAMTFSGLSARPARAQAVPEADARAVWALAATKAARTAAAIPADRYPQTTGAGTAWNLTESRAWTSGFWPGNLWLLYQATGDPAWKARAERAQAAIGPWRRASTIDQVGHDIGFMMMRSYGLDAHLTGDTTAKAWTLEAADALARRFNDKVGAIRSWGASNLTTEFRVIIDNMMNLELLMWAARNGGCTCLRDKAVRHARTTMREHVRPDGSTYHVVNFNPATGGVVWKRTAQGLADESTWSRGQAWGIHGFTMMYRETGDPDFLDTARRLADWYLAHLPADGVPYWDFDAPQTASEPRDSSSAAIAASGLLELARVDPDGTRRPRWLSSARGLLSALLRPAYYDSADQTAALLLHGTTSKTNGNADTGLIYGDHFLLEALTRLRWFAPSTAATPVTGVIAGASEPGFPARHAADGRFDTSWSIKGRGWLRLDLGSVKPVGAVRIAWASGGSRVTRFAIETSADGISWSPAAAGLSTGATAGLETSTFAPRSARYARITGYGDNRTGFTSIAEATVHPAS
jgi:unsaturated chondroitin disaccharide hydrolase